MHTDCYLPPPQVFLQPASVGRRQLPVALAPEPDGAAPRAPLHHQSGPRHHLQPAQLLLQRLAPGYRQPKVRFFIIHFTHLLFLSYYSYLICSLLYCCVFMTALAQRFSVRWHAYPRRPIFPTDQTATASAIATPKRSCRTRTSDRINTASRTEIPTWSSASSRGIKASVLAVILRWEIYIFVRFCLFVSSCIRMYLLSCSMDDKTES